MLEETERDVVLEEKPLATAMRRRATSLGGGVPELGKLANVQMHRDRVWCSLSLRIPWGFSSGGERVVSSRSQIDFRGVERKLSTYNLRPRKRQPTRRLDVSGRTAVMK